MGGGEGGDHKRGEDEAASVVKDAQREAKEIREKSAQMQRDTEEADRRARVAREKSLKEAQEKEREAEEKQRAAEANYKKSNAYKAKAKANNAQSKKLLDTALNPERLAQAAAEVTAGQYVKVAQDLGVDDQIKQQLSQDYREQLTVKDDKGFKNFNEFMNTPFGKALRRDVEVAEKAHAP